MSIDTTDDQLARQMMAESAFNIRRHTEGGFWVRWWFLGGLGVHRWYLGDKGMAWLILLTLGGFLGVIPLVDAFRSRTLLTRANERVRAQVYAAHGLSAPTV